MEQGRRVHTPIVELFDRFRPFVEDHLNGISTERNRYVGHPYAPVPLWQASGVPGPYTLIIGPDGGFIDYELGAMQACGFVSVRATSAPLRVESAISYLAGQLDLVHHLD
jgi:16S rRNA U1498 N3-methylase RsmE